MAIGWLPCKCARSWRVCKRVSVGNARGPRAISSGSLGKNERLGSAHVRCCPPPTGSDLVIGIGPPSGNARDPRAFSGPSSGPIAFPPHPLPAGWLPSKCARSSRVCKRVSAGNAPGPRAISIGSLGENERLGSGLVRCCPPPTVCRSLDCDRAPARKHARPSCIFEPFIWAIEFPPQAIAIRWLSSKCARSSRVCNRVSAGNARGPRAISSCSLGKTSTSGAGLSNVARHQPGRIS